MNRCIVKECEEEASRFGLNMMKPDNFAETEKHGPYCLPHLYRLIDLMGPGFWPNIAYFTPGEEV